LAEIQDSDFLRILRESPVVSPEEVRSAQELQRGELDRQGSCRSLFAILCEKGLIDERVVRSLKPSTDAFRLGTNAVIAMAVVVTLTIGAAAQPCLRKDFLIQLALFSKLDFGFKNVDFVGQLRIDAVCELFFPSRHPRIVSGLRYVVNAVRRAAQDRHSPSPLRQQ